MAVATAASLLSTWNLDPDSGPAVPQTYDRTFTFPASAIPPELTTSILTAKTTHVKIEFSRLFDDNPLDIFVDAELTPPASLSGGNRVVGQEHVWSVTPEYVPRNTRGMSSYKMTMFVTKGELGKVLGKVGIGEC